MRYQVIRFVHGIGCPIPFDVFDDLTPDAIINVALGTLHVENVDLLSLKDWIVLDEDGKLVRPQHSWPDGYNFNIKTASSTSLEAEQYQKLSRGQQNLLHKINGQIEDLQSLRCSILNGDFE